MNRRDSKPRVRARIWRAGRFSDQQVHLRAFTYIVSLTCAIAFSSTARADQLLAHGTSEMFWIARVVEPTSGSADELRTVVRARTVGGADAQWVDVAQLASRVSSLAHRGTQLAALLDSGTWMLLWPGGSSIGAQPRDGARLLMLASDNESIWSVGAGGEESTTTTRAAEPVAQQPRHPDALALYRLERGQWLRVAPLPRDVTSGDIARASFAVAGAGPTIAVLRFGGTVQVHTYRPNEAQWDAREPLNASDAAHVRLFTDGGGRSVLWVAPEAGAGRIYFESGDAWTEPRELRTDEVTTAGAARTAAWAGGALRLLFIRERTTFEQAFDPETGAPRTPARPLRTTGSTATDSVPSRIVTVAAAAMLLMVVLGSLRRASPGTANGSAPAAAPRVVPAPLVPRLLAGLIDLLPLGVACWFVFSDIDLDTQTLDGVTRRMNVPFYLALAGYLAYTFLAEALFARTVGKALLGLRVVSLDGSRPSVAAVFARNALRLVDITLLGLPLLFVLLSPLRQRVGDVPARTVVVSSRLSTTAAKRSPDDASTS